MEGEGSRCDGILKVYDIWQSPKSVSECLEELASALSVKNYDRSAGIIDSLAEQVVNVDIANRVLAFVVAACLLLREEFTTVRGPGLLEIFETFAKRLERFSRLDLWKAYVFELMALASFLPDSAGKLIELRHLNGEMQTVQTVAFASMDLDKVPLSCIPYVRCGLALQVSLDVEDGVSLSAVSLCNALLVASFLQEMYLSHSIVSYFERYLALVEAALQSCKRRDLTLELAFDLLEVSVMTLESGRLSDLLFERGLPLLVLIPMALSWPNAIKLFTLLVKDKHQPQMLVYLLASARGYIDGKWTSFSDRDNLDQNRSGFIELRGFFQCLLQKVLRCPTDANGLKLVEEVLHLYMAIVFHELVGKDDLSGLLAAEERKETESRLQELLDATRHHKFQDPFVQKDHRLLLNMLEYCIDISKDPSLILKHGRFLD